MQQRPRFRLEGKTAIVTGAGSSGPGVGTGKATAILFAREGAKVLLVDRSPELAEQTLAAIREEGGRLRFSRQTSPAARSAWLWWRRP